MATKAQTIKKNPTKTLRLTSSAKSRAAKGKKAQAPAT